LLADATTISSPVSARFSGAGQFGEPLGAGDDDRGDQVPQQRGLAGPRRAVHGEQTGRVKQACHDLVDGELLAQRERPVEVRWPPARRNAPGHAAVPDDVRPGPHVDPLSLVDERAAGQVRGQTGAHVAVG
jgi:hypothetical protein